jgi:hypothetical protein
VAADDSTAASSAVPRTAYVIQAPQDDNERTQAVNLAFQNATKQMNATFSGFANSIKDVIS